MLSSVSVSRARRAAQDYLAPKHIDPRFFQPDQVFKQEVQQTKSLNVLHKKMGKKVAAVLSPQFAIAQRIVSQSRNREGYKDDAGPLVFEKCSVAKFIEGNQPVGALC